MKKCNLIGLDIAKNSFEVCVVDIEGHVIERKRLSRIKVLTYFAEVSKSRVGLEACGGAHYWARQIQALGHDVSIIPPQYVKPFVITNKSDSNDAHAIAKALREPGTSHVPIADSHQQDLQALHRMRQRLIRERTALSNQMRGFLLEYGVSINQGMNRARSEIAAILQSPNKSLSPDFVLILQDQYSELLHKNTQIKLYTKHIEDHVAKDPAGVRVMKISGIGPLSASALLIKLRHAKTYKNGRHFSASLGLVPRHEGTGGVTHIRGMSKRGDTYLRTLLIHGARAVIRHRHKRTDSMGTWIKSLVDRRGIPKAAVALANKHARIAWRVITCNEEYKIGYTKYKQPVLNVCSVR